MLLENKYFKFGGVIMTRLERSKIKISKLVELGKKEEEIMLSFQELINNLPTYKEQKEFCQFYLKVMDNVLEKAK